MNTDEDNRSQDRLGERCKCGYPDMPGHCPGWADCPMANCEDSETEIR